MKHVVIASHSPEWHSWRQKGIGGSDAGILAADAGLIKPASWMKSVQYLWEIKTGRRSGISAPNFVMQRGIDGEPFARAAYEKKSGILLSPLYGENEEMPFIRSSFDGVDFSGDIIAEIKCASEKVHAAAKNGDVIDYYTPQIAHQAMTAWGHPETWKISQRCVFLSYVPETDELVIVDKSSHDYRDLAESLLEAEKAFWKKVEDGALPCGDDWSNAAVAFLLVKAKQEQLEAEEQEAKNTLLSLLADKQKMSGAGVSVTRQSKAGSVDYAKIVSEKLKLTPEELEAFRKKGSSSVVFRQLSGAEKEDA
jgi:putative phage-type endonuclease